MYLTITNTWLTGIYMAYIFNRNSGGKTSQIEWLFESDLRSFGYFKCSTCNLASSGPQMQRQSAYKSWLGTSGPKCHLIPKIGDLQKKQMLHSNPRYNPEVSMTIWWAQYIILHDGQWDIMHRYLKKAVDLIDCVWHFTGHSALCTFPLMKSIHWNVIYTQMKLQFCLSVCSQLVDITHYPFIF